LSCENTPLIAHEQLPSERVIGQAVAPEDVGRMTLYSTRAIIFNILGHFGEFDLMPCEQFSAERSVNNFPFPFQVG
jgi:hypothetical protein